VTSSNVPPLKQVRLLAISDAAPSRNGAGAYYHDLMEQMQGRAEQALLYSPTIDENGKWHAGLIFPLPGDKTQKLCFPNVIGMGRLFREMKPDVVVIATPGVYGIVGAWLARKNGIPYLTGMHTSFEQLTELYWPNSIQGKIVEHYFRFSNGTLFRHTEAVLGNAEPILQQATTMGAPATRLIGTPLSSEFITPEHHPYQGHMESCLFAGRLAQEKNIESLLQSVEDFPGIRFSVAGDGPLRKMVEDATARLDNLDYLGWLNRKQLRETVDDHDVLLLPSYFETFGTIALEAMAREKLVFVSEGCGIAHWESLTPGLVVISEDGLSKTLQDQLDRSPEERQATARSGRERAIAWNNQVMDLWAHIISDTVSDYAEKHSVSRQ